MLKDGGQFKSSELADRTIDGVKYGECIFESTDGPATLDMAVETWYGYSLNWDFKTEKAQLGFEKEA